MNVSKDTPKPPAWQDRSVMADAWEVHSALLKAEAAMPELRDNPRWTIAKQDAYERFAVAFIKASDK